MSSEYVRKNKVWRPGRYYADSAGHAMRIHEVQSDCCVVSWPESDDEPFSVDDTGRIIDVGLRERFGDVRLTHDQIHDNWWDTFFFGGPAEWIDELPDVVV